MHETTIHVCSSVDDQPACSPTRRRRRWGALGAPQPRAALARHLTACPVVTNLHMPLQARTEGPQRAHSRCPAPGPPASRGLQALGHSVPCADHCWRGWAAAQPLPARYVRSPCPNSRC